MKNVPIKYWNFQIDIINKHANYLNFRDSWQYLIYRKKAYFYDQLLCDNEADKEAIRVEMEGLGLIGYVASSPYTVQGESMSAGRIYVM